MPYLPDLDTGLLQWTISDDLSGADMVMHADFGLIDEMVVVLYPSVSYMMHTGLLFYYF